jgi:hypothetical protein
LLFSGEGDEELGAALGAPHPCEAAVEDAAVEERIDGIFDAGAPETVAALEFLSAAPLDLVVEGVDEPIKRRCLRLARPIERAVLFGQEMVLLPSRTRTRFSGWLPSSRITRLFAREIA